MPSCLAWLGHNVLRLRGGPELLVQPVSVGVDVRDKLKRKMLTLKRMTAIYVSAGKTPHGSAATCIWAPTSRLLATPARHRTGMNRSQHVQSW